MHEEDHPDTLKDSKITVYENLIAVETGNKMQEDKIYDMCYIGRITKPKGIFDLIKVLKLLLKENIKLKVAVIGAYNNKIKTKLDKLIRKSELQGQVIFFGYVSNKQKIETLKKSKLFISLSYEEGWNISLMEAASYGVPIIAYELCAYTYLNMNYYSIPPGNLIKVRSVIKTILNDPDLLNKYVENARDCVNTYNYKEISEIQLKYIHSFLYK